MSESFKKFRQTGKVEDYLKYRSEVSKELLPKDVKKDKKEQQKDKKKSN